MVRRTGTDSTAFETFIKITADGSVAAYNGHVDLGTGIRTALGQIVAEELDVSFARVVVVLGVRIFGNVAAIRRHLFRA